GACFRARPAGFPGTTALPWPKLLAVAERADRADYPARHFRSRQSRVRDAPQRAGNRSASLVPTIWVRFDSRHSPSRRSVSPPSIPVRVSLFSQTVVIRWRPAVLGGSLRFSQERTRNSSNDSELFKR